MGREDKLMEDVGETEGIEQSQQIERNKEKCKQKKEMVIYRRAKLK